MVLFWKVPGLYLPWLYHFEQEIQSYYSQACWVSLSLSFILSMHVQKVCVTCVKTVIFMMMISSFMWLQSFEELRVLHGSLDMPHCCEVCPLAFDTKSEPPASWCMLMFHQVANDDPSFISTVNMGNEIWSELAAIWRQINSHSSESHQHQRRHSWSGVQQKLCCFCQHQRHHVLRICSSWQLCEFWLSLQCFEVLERCVVKKYQDYGASASDYLYWDILAYTSFKILQFLIENNILGCPIPSVLGWPRPLWENLAS